MALGPQRKLHWRQRVALVRHNLHTASRTGDFGFFKALQASAFLEGTDYVGTLNATLGDDADTVQSTLDNLNAGIAYVHQDAFKNVYEAAKRAVVSVDLSANERAAQIHVDALQQKQMADNAIDRMTNSATSLIQTQPAIAQEAVANVWISGTTIIADVVEVCIRSIGGAERCGEDFIRLEDLSSTVTSAVEAGISALKGIFGLLEANSPSESQDQHMAKEGYGRSMFRRLSTAISNGSGSLPSSRSASAVSVHSPQFRSASAVSVPGNFNSGMNLQMPAKFRSSCSSVPSRVQQSSVLAPQTLPTIPPTPFDDGQVDPLDTSGATQENGLGPLNETPDEMFNPGIFRRLSGAFWPADDKSSGANVEVNEKPLESHAQSEKPVTEQPQIKRQDSCNSSLHTLSNLSLEEGKPLPLGACGDDDYSRGIFHRLASALATENQQPAPQVAV